MSLVPVLRFLAFALFAVALAGLGPLLLATGFDEDPAPFAAAVFIATFLGGCFYALSRTMTLTPPVRSGFRELILALSIFWLAVPFAACLPFLAQGFSFWSAWFEAVSAVTTTGAWLSEPAARVSLSGMLYRASLEWLGGIVSLATAAAVFVRPEFIGVMPPVPPFARGKRDSYLRAFSSAFNAFLPVYAGVTAMSFAAFLFTGVPVEDAAALALSLIASGGFAPTPGGIEAYGTGTVFVAGVTLFVSAVNFVVIARLALRGGDRLRSGPDPETRALLLLIIPVATLFWFTLEGWAFENYPAQIFNAISLLSTNGALIGEIPQLTPLLVTAVIGGAAVSTAGGIKLLRWLITFERLGHELWQLVHPGGVLNTRRPPLFEFGVWIHTIAFTIVLSSLTLTVAFFGYELELAVGVAVAVVTNAGPLIEAVPGSTTDYIQFAEPLRIVLALGMIAGRLELILLLLVFDPDFWRA
ncbi:TrkH family potassium uptake protein [Parvularcula sp. ZS-1/3]|uniref:TrkH family potassium uptake protein n=1 Tax=Parvularcula mediterranea TaxID=2732508 RepID=A0A7Y3RP61_9PROT|nr:TrkH family potassium uptake protein [Parvularcula mediterranea]NNU17714.1 TrkH family potassium uptake protein [Parvularcula mediterranea]